MEDVMYDPPAYIWAITIALTAAIPAATCIVLYSGAKRAGLDRRRAALLAGAAAAVLGGWFTATAVIAGHGWYHTSIGHGVPWLPIAVAGFFGTLLALRRIPVSPAPWRHPAWRAAWSTRTCSGWKAWPS
jgi:drug/metabolite transporter (DMT)-like permease